MKFRYAIIVLALTLAGASLFEHEHLVPGQPTRSEHLIMRNGYVCLWDDVRRCPLWVQWHLKPEYIVQSKASRPAWRSNPDVPGTPTPNDYAGWDRGHLFPFADAARSREIQVESMELTNVAPQAVRLNRGSWGRYEGDVRDVAKRSDEVYVVVVTAGYSRSSGSGISVPDRFAKIVAARRGEQWKILSVVAENTDLGKVEPTSRQEIERQSGFRFLPKIEGEQVKSIDNL